MTFASLVLNHVYASLHLLEQMCRFRLVGAQQYLINEEDGFLLIGAQSCVW
jgi:hypothetical protein